MREPGKAKAEQDARASGAKPKPEGHVRERGWRPTRGSYGIGDARTEAPRRRAIAAADALALHPHRTDKEAA